MSDHKSQKLVEAEEAWDRFQELQGMIGEARENFVDKVQEAKQAKATQQEIADIVGLSRQRIAQFLDERKKHG